MALLFRCAFLVALLGMAALGDKGAGNTRKKGPNSGLGTFSRHRGDGKYLKIQPRSPLAPVQESVDVSNSSGAAVPKAATNESTSQTIITPDPPPGETKKDCKCIEDEEEEEKEECVSECEKKESKSKSKSRSKSKPKSPSKSKALSSPSQDSVAQPQQEVQVNVQGEVQQSLENGKDNTGNQSPSAGSPGTPNSKPADAQVGGSLSENRPGAEKEHAAPQNSGKQLGSTNNDGTAKDNADETESIGDASEKEKAENNDETKGGHDGQGKPIDSSEGQTGENGSAETSSANFSGKTLTVLLLAILACFGAW
ncbi:hypothetical protein TRVL_08454 [Trypanosoma vivax]|nr:hypothetical protein TRVL_08454 [Trypanosoma vivax]